MFTPSVYQKNIFDFVVKGKGNAVIEAVAGSGKTTTIVKALELVPAHHSVAFMAFNKAIVEELRTRVPKSVDVMTFHSCGAKALFKARKSQLNDKKVYSVIDIYKRTWISEDAGMMDAEYTGRVKKLVDLARMNLTTDIEQLHEIAERYSIELMNGECGRALQVLNRMNTMKNEHDFADMIYLAASDESLVLPKYDWIFVDECQDLNRAQQRLLMKLMKPSSRFIAVGDRGQAIYGFAGADAQSFENLTRIPNTVILPLSINYRCGKNIIKYAKRYVPALEAAPDAIDGVVDEKGSYKIIKDGDMVLCRNNAPLVKLCLQFIREGKKAYVKGSDIGKSMINLIERSKMDTIDQFESYMERQLLTVYQRLIKKYSYAPEADIKLEPAYSILHDKKQILEIIADEQGIKTCTELIDWVTKIFSDDKKGVCFSSVHKSKGLESENVHIIERDLMPCQWVKKDWQKVQEDNLIYVAFTRAKNLLSFVTDWEFDNNKKKR